MLVETHLLYADSVTSLLISNRGLRNGNGSEGHVQGLVVMIKNFNLDYGSMEVREGKRR